MESNILLLKIIEKDLIHNLATNKLIFSYEECDFYKKGRQTNLSLDVIDHIKDTLLKNDIFLPTNHINEEKELISLKVQFEQIQERFTFTILPTKSEIIKFNNREISRQKFFEEELIIKILALTDKQSVNLINDVLGFENLSWIKQFKKSKSTRDGGIDFIAQICIDKNNNIDYDGYGKFFTVYGQLKHLKGKMSESAIRDLIGTITKDHSKIQFGLAISSRGFSDDCKRIISEVALSKSNKINKIFYFDISFIVKLMIKYKIGLKTHKIKSGLFVNEEWWNEIKFFIS